MKICTKVFWFMKFYFDSLPTVKILTLHNVTILIMHVLNKDQNYY